MNSIRTRVGLWQRAIASEAPPAVILIRILVGSVFLSEGIQKFLFPAALGVGRFEKIGIPAPSIMGPFVGGVEIVCGALVLLGLLTRLAAVPLLIDMLVAITSTKIPILLGRAFIGFAGPPAGKGGFWAMAHESRTDLTMALGALFLLSQGAGPWSIDARLADRLAPKGEP